MPLTLVPGLQDILAKPGKTFHSAITTNNVPTVFNRICFRYFCNVEVFIYCCEGMYQNTKHQTPNTKHQTPNTKHQTPNTKHQTPNTKHQTPNTTQTIHKQLTIQYIHLGYYLHLDLHQVMYFRLKFIYYNSKLRILSN
jgi:hypothetical protein